MANEFVARKGIISNGDIALKNRITIGGSSGGSTTGAGFWTDYIAGGKTSLGALTSGNGYGIFYYQGGAGRDGNDSIDFSFNTTTAASSVMSVKTNGEVKISGAVTATNFIGNWNGYTYSASSGVNAMVQRDSSGYIQNNYFYTSAGGAERNASGMGYFTGFNTGDYYIRSYTAAGAATLLSGQTMNIVGSSTTATSLNGSNYISQKGSQGNWNSDFGTTPAGTLSYGGDLAANGVTGPGGSWWFQQNFRHTNASNLWGTQVAWGWEDNQNKLATRNVSGGSFNSWVYYINSSNLASYVSTVVAAPAAPSLSFQYNNGGVMAGQGANNAYDIDLGKPLVLEPSSLHPNATQEGTLFSGVTNDARPRVKHYGGQIGPVDGNATQTLTAAANVTMYWGSGSNAYLLLNVSTALLIYNVPDGASGTIVVERDASPTETFSLIINSCTSVIVGANQGITSVASKHTTVTYKRIGGKALIVYGWQT